MRTGHDIPARCNAWLYASCSSLSVRTRMNLIYKKIKIQSPENRYCGTAANPKGKTKKRGRQFLRPPLIGASVASSEPGNGNFSDFNCSLLNCRPEASHHLTTRRTWPLGLHRRRLSPG